MFGELLETELPDLAAEQRLPKLIAATEAGAASGRQYKRENFPG